MNSNLNATEPKKPNLTSWLAAFVGIGFLLSTTAVATIKLESIRIKNELAALKADGNIISEISRIVEPKGLAKYLTKNESSKPLSELGSVEASLLEKDYSSASQKLVSLSGSEDLSRRVEVISERAKANLKLIKEKEEKEKSFEGIATDYQTLKAEVLLFFGLRPEDSKDKSISFYQAGILQGLPTISLLPDDISDLQAFSAKLTSAGGKIEIQNSENPAEVFQQKLDELKDRAFNISLSNSTVHEKLEKIDKLLSDNEQKNTKELSEIHHFLNELALSLVRR